MILFWSLLLLLEDAEKRAVLEKSEKHVFDFGERNGVTFTAARIKTNESKITLDCISVVL